MTLTNIVVLFGGLLLNGGIAWFFWGPRKSGQRAALTTSGYQEAMILVKGGYTPDVIVVQHGKPVRLNFRREETATCSELVIFTFLVRAPNGPQGKPFRWSFYRRKQEGMVSPARWACSVANSL